MVEGQACITAGANGNGIIHHLDPFFDDAHAKNRGLGLIDNRRGEQTTTDAMIGNRDRATLNVIWF